MALQIPASKEPVRRRWSNLVGIAGRLVLGVVYLLLGGGYLWLALIEASSALLLVHLYYRLGRAELMSRP